MPSATAKQARYPYPGKSGMALLCSPSPTTARASTRVPQGFELTYELAEEQPLVSVIIVNRDCVDALDRCLTSMRELTTYENYEVIIVEQGSSQPETFDYYRRAEEVDSRVRTIFYQGHKGQNHARLVNFGVSRAKGSYLLLLAPDTEVVDGGWMERLVSLCAPSRHDTLLGRIPFYARAGIPRSISLGGRLQSSKQRTAPQRVNHLGGLSHGGRGGV